MKKEPKPGSKAHAEQLLADALIQIEDLHEEVKDLESSNECQRGTIEDLEGELADKDDEIAKLEEEVENLEEQARLWKTAAGESLMLPNPRLHRP